jgi:putative endonuclease
VYILASRRNGTLHVGVTSDLARHVSQHRSGAAEDITRNYGVLALVFAEFHETMEDGSRGRSGSRNGGAPGNWN